MQFVHFLIFSLFFFVFFKSIHTFWPFRINIKMMVGKNSQIFFIFNQPRATALYGFLYVVLFLCVSLFSSYSAPPSIAKAFDHSMWKSIHSAIIFNISFHSFNWKTTYLRIFPLESLIKFVYLPRIIAAQLFSVFCLLNSVSCTQIGYDFSVNGN